MATWPAGMSEVARAYVARRSALLDRLRWAPHGSKRRKKLTAELAQLVREELQRETKPAEAADEPPEHKTPWYDR